MTPLTHAQDKQLHDTDVLAWRAFKLMNTEGISRDYKRDIWKHLTKAQKAAINQAIDAANQLQLTQDEYRDEQEGRV